MTILIVEDDEDIRAMIAIILDSEGYDVAAASDGRDALRFLRTHKNVNLVLTDIMMPFVDGWLLVRAMRADPTLASIPVVMMTGAITPMQPMHSIPLLRKPFHMDELLAVVRAQCALSIAGGAGVALDVAAARDVGTVRDVRDVPSPRLATPPPSSQPPTSSERSSRSSIA